VSNDSIVSAGLLAAFRDIDLGARAEERLEEKRVTLWSGLLDAYDVAAAQQATYPAKREVRYAELAHLYKRAAEVSNAAPPRELWLDLPVDKAPVIREYLNPRLALDHLQADDELQRLGGELLTSWRPRKPQPSWQQPQQLAQPQSIPTELLEHFLSSLPAEQLQDIAASVEQADAYDGQDGAKRKREQKRL
jgi:hypothetical protein